MALENLVPKKFVYCYPLKVGALIVGAVMSCIMVACIIVTSLQVLNMKHSGACFNSPWRNAYSYSVTAILYSVAMLCVNLWFIWGVNKHKSSVILSWVVITSMWLAQTLCLLIALICIYSTEANFTAWLLSLIFGIVAIGILLYGLLVGFGYWYELKKLAKSGLALDSSQ